MAGKDKFDAILKEYKALEENIFISRASDIVMENRRRSVRRIKLELANPNINLHLKYLLIKLIGSLKYQNFVPVLATALQREDKVRIIYEILNSLANIVTIESYKVVVAFFSEEKNKTHLTKFMSYLKIYYGKSPLVYHFDLFYRERGDVKNIEISSTYLIKHLDDTYIKDLLPAIFSHYRELACEALRILEKRPGPLFYHSILDVFQHHFSDDDTTYYRQLVRSLIKNAAVSPHRKRIYRNLKSLIPSQLDARKTYFILHLLHLDMADLFEEALLIYPDLNLEEKVVFFDNLDNEKYPVYSHFIRDQIQQETKEEILFKIIRILLANREYDLIFDTAFRMKGTRREILVNLIIEAEESGLSQYFARFLSLTEMNAVLVASIGYIMSQEPDEFYVEIHKILFSGVERQIKQKIIRNIKHFNSRNRKRILRQILSHAIVLKGIEKDFLLMIIALQDEEILDASMLDKLLNKVLTMMEETDPENLVNFIYFFDSFKVNTDEHRLFIIEELKMVQNTLFRSNADDTLVNLIYKLVRKMEGLA